MKMIDLKRLAERAEEFGAAASAVIDTADIEFVPDFRAACEANTCGNLGRNWMCPPNVGEPEELKAEALKFPKGVVFQTVYQLEDAFDFEGMQEAGKVHENVFRRLFDYIGSVLNRTDFLPMSIGGCKFCNECSCPSGEPCRFPDKAVASLEAYCIDVNNLLTGCGIPYNNGPATVSCVGLFLFADHSFEKGTS